jgi:hypothetical protein
MSCAAPKLSIGWFSSSKLRKASCFSAVSPVCGWNQCVKCVTPFSIAQSLIASATGRGDVGVELLPEADGRLELLVDLLRQPVAHLARAEGVVPKYADVGVGGRVAGAVAVDRGADGGTGSGHLAQRELARGGRGRGHKGAKGGTTDGRWQTAGGRRPPVDGPAATGVT